MKKVLFSLYSPDVIFSMPPLKPKSPLIPENTMVTDPSPPTLSPENNATTHHGNDSVEEMNDADVKVEEEPISDLKCDVSPCINPVEIVPLDQEVHFQEDDPGVDKEVQCRCIVKRFTG